MTTPDELREVTLPGLTTLLDMRFGGPKGDQRRALIATRECISTDDAFCQKILDRLPASTPEPAE